MIHLRTLGEGEPSGIEQESGPIVIGRASRSDLALIGDSTVSRVHAVVLPLAGGWLLRDLGSRNGTYLNGVRVDGEVVLHDQDEILAGGSRIIVRLTGWNDEATAGPEEPPQLTRSEAAVLGMLIAPLEAIGGANRVLSVRDIAEKMGISVTAVYHCLALLYEKFGITGDGSRRQVRLANEALRRGAITMDFLRNREPG